MFKSQSLHLYHHDTLHPRRFIYIESAYYEAKSNGFAETEAVKEVRGKIGQKAETIGKNLDDVLTLAAQKLENEEPMNQEDAQAFVKGTESYINQETQSVLNDSTINRTLTDGTPWYKDLNHPDLKPIKEIHDASLSRLQEAANVHQKFLDNIAEAGKNLDQAGKIFNEHIPRLTAAGISIYNNIFKSGDPSKINNAQLETMEMALAPVQDTILVTSAKGVAEMHRILQNINNLGFTNLPSIRSIEKTVANWDDKLTKAHNIVQASSIAAAKFLKNVHDMANANYRNDGKTYMQAKNNIVAAKDEYEKANPSIPKDQPEADPNLVGSSGQSQSKDARKG